MKHIRTFVALGIVGALFCSATFAFAQNTKLEMLKEAARARAQQAAQQVKQMREQAQTQVKQVKTNLDQKIAQIKDQRKKTIAMNLSGQFDHINQVWTDHFTLILDKLDAVLQRVKSRAQKAADNGHDVSAVNTAVQGAESAIAAARTAVANQAKKTYTVDVSSMTQETSSTNGQTKLNSDLKIKFKEVHNQLQNDLTALRDGVIRDARTAVKSALQALAGVPGVDEEPEPKPNTQK